MSKNIYAAFVMAFGGLMLMGFALPQYHHYTAFKQAVVERSVLQRDSSSAIDAIHDLDGKYSANEDTYKRMLVFIPNTQQSDFIASSIQAAAIQSGVQLSSLALSEGSGKKEGAEYQILPVSIHVAGPYYAILSFLSSLEQSLRLYDVQNLQMTKASDHSGNSALQADIRFVTYSLK